MGFGICDKSVANKTAAASSFVADAQSQASSGNDATSSLSKKCNDQESNMDSNPKKAIKVATTAKCTDKRNSLTKNKTKSVRKVVTMKKIKLSDNEDHSYSDPQFAKTENANQNLKSDFVHSKVEVSGKEKFVGLKITNLNDLKKSTPRLKLPVLLTSTTGKTTPATTVDVKNKLHKYCRTCAGLKVPLVDIFSEKGVQMRLSQQIQHLENINQHDSLSTQMCMDCICDMRMSYKFFMQIKKAEVKLKSICNSLNDSTPQTPQANSESQTNANTEPATSGTKESSKEIMNNIENIEDVEDVKYEPEDLDYQDNNDSCSGGNDGNDGNESFEEFDPDNPNDANENGSHKSVESETECKTVLNKSIESDTNLKKSIESDTNLNKSIESKSDLNEITESKINLVETTESAIDLDGSTENHKNTAYKFDKCLNAYIKVEIDEKMQVVKQKSRVEENVRKVTSTSSGHLNQSSKLPNILKRKLSNGDESTDKSNKIDFQKLRDLKIPKLNFQDTKAEEDGVMYVTAKGSKPNEMLLIKVKKVDKPTEKKVDKFPSKKKGDSIATLKIYSKSENDNKKDSVIEEQIEEYKKKRVQILGENANTAETNFDEEVRIVCSDNSADAEILEQIESDATKEDPEYDDTLQDISGVTNETYDVTPEQAMRLEKMQQRWKDIKKRHADINKDLAEDCTDRLTALLRQKDEYIQSFINYLKQRRIVVSRLKDDDIISLYEAKNNVVIDRTPLQSTQEPEEGIDPFEFREVYECDFCDQYFPDRDMEFEHSKIHDFKLMHYCEDCEQEFITHKAKRSHNVTCVQKLMCKYCDMILESKGKKRQHEQKHCDDQYGQLCDMCGEKFKHLGTLDQHVKTRHMELEKIYKCPQCSKKFAFRTKLTFHLKSVHTTCRAYLCEDCGSDFKNPASLRHHRIRKHATVNNKKECTVCHKMIPVYSMSKHMHTHKAYTIECPHCDKMFKNTSTLKQHLKIHEDQRQYKCDMCGVGFNRRDGLRLHMKVHMKTDSRGLKECSCQLCGEKFPNHSMLVIHRNRTHKDGRNYTCHICNRSMISTRSLEWHLAHIHNETMPGIVKDESTVDAETKRVSCYHCNKTFKTEMILRTHVKNSHVEKEPMKCSDCDQVFTSEVRLKHHMMVTHERLEGTLGCPHCTKRFVNQLRLKTHMISHSNERPYSCDLCGFMLKTKIQLIKHKQNRHSNERPLQCKYCSWRCKQVSALVCHERTHTNERPYTCSVCKQKFKYLGDKNKHERRHEVLGGSGFKRIVTGRNTNKQIVRKKEEDSTTGQDSEQEQVYEHQEGEEDQEEYEEQGGNESGDVETFDETQIIKFDTSEMIADESDASFEPVYVEDTSQDVPESMEEATVYTEEVTADHSEHEVLESDLINEHMLQPGTVLHLQQRDETGKMQVIPVMLSLPDLSDPTQVSLATASIMYST